MKRIVIALALSVSVNQLQAQTGNEGSGPTFGGVGSVSAGRTNHGTYLAGTSEGSYRNSQFGLRTSVPFGDRLSVSALVNWREVGLTRGAPQTDITFLFATYRLSRAWDLRIGKVKSPSNLYSEVFDIGTLRPFLTLPQGIYGGTANSFTSYTGVGVNGTAYVKNWQLGVAGYLSGGNFQYKSTRYDLLPGQNGEVDVTIRQAIGGRIFVRPPVPGLLVGLSGVAGQISTCPIVVAMVPCQSNIRGRQGSAQLEYLSDRVWFRSEAALIEGPGFLASRGGYVQGAFFLSRKWQIAAQHDVLRETLKVPELSGPLAPLFPRALDTHSDNSIGLNYWFSPDMVVKWSVHDVRGWRFANPGRNVMLQGLQTQQFPDVRSRLLQAGIQFNF